MSASQPTAQKRTPRSRANATRPATALSAGTLARELLRWFSRAPRDLPWRRTLDPYAIWVSEVMLQQTQVRTVIPYFERWMRALPTIAGLAAAPPQKVLKLWEGLGYYTRARNLHQAARTIVARHGGQFPRTFDQILALPGVGRYTAGAISSIAFNQPTPVLDGNVIRILTRLRGIRLNPARTATRHLLWTLAKELVEAAAAQRPMDLAPRRGLRFAGNCSAVNQALMELGAIVCTPGRPRCPACPLRGHCVARRQRKVEDYPARPARPATTTRRSVVFVIEDAGCFLVRQRPEGVVNARFWEFPNCDLTGPGTQPLKLVSRELGLNVSDLRSFCRVQHSITRYRIRLEILRGNLAGQRRPGIPGGRWLRLSALRALPVTSSHRKILARLETAARPI